MAGGGAIYGGVGGVFGSGSCSSSTALHGAGSRSMVSFGNVHRNFSDGLFYWPPDQNDIPDEEVEEMFQHSDKKRRLTVEQVHLLEKSFEIENKLEPERKVQLAKDLGLQPRQVAIWFQNRRARWKTKQLEKEYDALKSKFDNLKGSYEGLLEEKEKLKSEVLHLTDKLLLKEGESNEAPNFNSPKSPLQARETLAENSLSSMKAAGVPHVAIEQEDLNSSNSVVSDSDSPRYIKGSDKSLIDRTESSDILDSDQSDVPYASEEDNNLRKTSLPASHYFLKQENDCTVLQGHCGSHGLPVEDESLWLWDY